MKTKELASIMAIYLIAGCGAIGGGAKEWKEEVVQPDGKVVVVKRSQLLASNLDRELSSINAPPRAKSYSITIPLSNGNQALWEAEHKDMVPLALSISGNTVQILASPFNCSAYAKFGEPVPPFINFRFDGVKWERTSIDDFPAGIKEANLLISTSTQSGYEEINKGLVTSRAIRRLNETIVRRRIYRQGIDEYLWGGCLRELKAGWYRQEKTKSN